MLLNQISKMISKIPFEFVAIESDGVHIIFEALISKHSCRMLIDTGASRTVFDQNRIDRFISEPELTENEQLSTGLGTNNMRSHIISIPSLIIGDLHLTNYCVVWVHDFEVWCWHFSNV